MTDVIISAAITVAGLGLASAVLLVLADIFMGVKINPVEGKIRDCLPGANCGACGFSGCDAYAKALAENAETPANLCRPGGKETTESICSILGVEAEAAEPITAFVHCGGDCSKQVDKAIYQGLRSCAAAKMLYGGKGSCLYGCLGCGDCAAVCTNDAICIVNGVAKVNPEKCAGCGLCVAKCPNHLISLVPKAEKAVITCSNHEKGAVVRKECQNGCIGCMKCQKNCPAEAIKVENFLASVDYEKCIGCGKCVEDCPVGCLEMLKA
ncbi:MAG: RnfABCDGE type electron transport complex subunit B [Oscillospiraceae bacterium]|nr:RnfABCDGE type electron transport complex subunit B [Oscillospiraceae bacterium]MBQ4546383.1 RnfABCDGE type electron transport complex subunit B [Oscillospiraceae bacterium]